MMLNGFLSALEWMAPGLVALAIDPEGLAGRIMLVGFVIVASGLALAACTWVLRENGPSDERRRSAATDQARARAELALCETLLREADTPIVVWDGDSLERLSFSNGAELLDACL